MRGAESVLDSSSLRERVRGCSRIRNHVVSTGRGSQLDTLRCERTCEVSRSIQLGSNQIPRSNVARPADRRCENSVQGSSQRVCPRRTLGCVRSSL